MDRNILSAIGAIGAFMVIQLVIYPAIGRAWRALDKEKLGDRVSSIFLFANVAAIVFVVLATCSRSASDGCQSFGRGIDVGDC